MDQAFTIRLDGSNIEVVEDSEGRFLHISQGKYGGDEYVKFDNNAQIDHLISALQAIRD
jgi:hypothetical protein